MSDIIKKSIGVLVICSFLLNFCMPSYAQISNSHEESNEFTYSEEEINEISKSLEKNFSDIGYLKDSDTYELTNYDLLKKNASEGDFFSGKLLEEYKRPQPYVKSWKGLGKCVANHYFGPFIKFVNGQYLRALENALLQKAWRQAGSILARALGEVSKRLGYKVSGLFAVAEVSYYVYLCKKHI